MLARVSQVDPELRIRFTSPHPKDFPDEVLRLISERPNLCKSLHMPAQVQPPLPLTQNYNDTVELYAQN